MRQDNGFWFAGEHSLRDHGLIAVKNATRTVSAPGEVYSYSIGGIPGTLAYSDSRKRSTFDQQVSLYGAKDLDDETTANRLWDTVRLWLTQGRRQLVWDSDPDHVWTAEVVKIEASTSSDWVDEYLKITFRIQPECRARDPWVTTITGISGSVTTRLTADTGLLAPVNITLTNNDSKNAIVNASFYVHQARVHLKGLNLVNGDKLEINMETPIGAVITRTDGTQESALPYCSIFQRMGAAYGDNLVLATSGTTDAEVRVEIRGSWA